MASLIESIKLGWMSMHEECEFERIGLIIGGLTWFQICYILHNLWFISITYINSIFVSYQPRIEPRLELVICSESGTTAMTLSCPDSPWILRCFVRGPILRQICPVQVSLNPACLRTSNVLGLVNRLDLVKYRTKSRIKWLGVGLGQTC